jgi:hypothetical protein
MSSRRRERIITFLAVLAGILLSGVVVLTTSRAVFSDTAASDGNYFATGDVDLTDELENATVLFEVDDMVPGQAEERCIEVTYLGSLDPDLVKVYSGGATDDGLAEWLAVTIEQGVGGNYADCSGFGGQSTIFDGSMDDFLADHTDYASGVGSWDPSAAGEKRTYRITVVFDENAPDTTQGASLTDLSFVWEVQS